jgi:hypothetical protein
VIKYLIILYLSLYISEIIEDQIVGVLSRMADMRNPQNILVGGPTGESSLERKRSIW